MEVNSSPLLEALRSQYLLHGKKYLCAYSGGLDSHVLLHAASKMNDIELRAIHIHHGLHADADTWAEHCTKVCLELNIPLSIIKVHVDKHAGDGVEAAARHARYQAIAEHIASDEVLLTAHHQEDQAETILLRLLRGSGSQGLAAMRTFTNAHGFPLWRPLLAFSKNDLQSYATSEKLTWINDPSNSAMHFDRNYLRQEVMPLLTSRWPQASSNMARSARLLEEEHQCLREQSEIYLAQVQGVDSQSISTKALLQHSKAWRAQILRCWIETLQAAPLPGHALDTIEETLLNAKPDAQALVQWAGVEIMAWRDFLYLQKTSTSMPEHWQHTWSESRHFMLPNGERWGFEATDEKNLDEAFLHRQMTSHFDGPLLVGLRQGGEKIQLKNREHHSLVKHLLQELGVPPWERIRLPLLFSAYGKCLAVGDILLSARFEAFCKEHAVRFGPMV